MSQGDKEGLIRQAAIRVFAREGFHQARIVELSIPFAAVACDIDTGVAVVLRRGPLADAMRASASIPGIFHPVRWEGHLLLAGGPGHPSGSAPWVKLP